MGSIPGGLSNVVAIAAGYFHNLALKRDGTVVEWGNTNMPPGNPDATPSNPNQAPPGLSNVVAIAGGGHFSLALRSDGTVVAWGNGGSATNVPPELSNVAANVAAIAAGGEHSLALVPPQPPEAVPVQSVSVLEDTDVAFALQGTNSIGNGLTAKVTRLPLAGSLYQYDNGNRGAPIANVPENVTDPDRSLIYAPNTNRNGLDFFQFSLIDSTGVASLPAFLSIQVLAVNDAPSFEKGPDQIVSEGTGYHEVHNWATNISPGAMDESNQVLTFLVLSNDNKALFTTLVPHFVGNAFAYSLAANGTGTAHITIALKDNGGTANGGFDTSPPQTFLITVLPALRFQEIRFSNNVVSLRFVARVGQAYEIQASTNLVNWVTLATRSPDDAGQIAFEDGQAGEGLARFYRVAGP